MFVESCPGGTIWDDINKACVWPDMQATPQLDQQQVQQVPILTEADMQCRGQRPETVIPLETGRKFIVCLDDSKGVEQHCPKGLYYHPQSQRCERKLGPLENRCVSQPCLNGGQCIPVDSEYQCQCAPGFDGKTCELDARVCQTQQPCGQAPDTRCQSFRLGAALQYVCILQEGRAYGLSPSQAQQSPCQGVDGAQALAFSNNGFIMCDGERMFVESCPGGTGWDDVNKACVWPDMQTVPQLDQQQGYGQQRMIVKSTYGDQWSGPQIQQSRPIQMIIPHQQEQPKNIQSYGDQWSGPQIQQSRPIQMIIPHQLEQPRNIQSYGSRITIPQQLEQPKLVQSYGGQVTIPQQLEQPKVVQSYGGQVTLPQQSRMVHSFGDQIPLRRQFEHPKIFQSYGGQQQQQQQQDNLVSVKQTSGY